MRSSNAYVQLDSAVIEQARQMDLPSYLRAYGVDTRGFSFKGASERVCGNGYAGVQG